MKKVIYIISLFLVSIIFFFVGIYYDNFLKINITGTYKNYNYNEPEKVIFFNKDGTCVYIDDNEQCNWKKKDNKVFITITKLLVHFKPNK